MSHFLDDSLCIFNDNRTFFIFFRQQKIIRHEKIKKSQIFVKIFENFEKSKRKSIIFFRGKKIKKLSGKNLLPCHATLAMLGAIDSWKMQSVRPVAAQMESALF